MPSLNSLCWLRDMIKEKYVLVFWKYFIFDMSVGCIPKPFEIFNFSEGDNVWQFFKTTFFHSFQMTFLNFLFLSTLQLKPHDPCLVLHYVQALCGSERAADCDKKQELQEPNSVYKNKSLTEIYKIPSNTEHISFLMLILSTRQHRPKQFDDLYNFFHGCIFLMP